MPTAIQGLRGTGEFDETVRPRNYRELYTLLEPNGSAPFNALLAMGSSESTNDPEFKNFRDELPERRLKIDNAGGYNSSATTLTIDASVENKFAIRGALVVNSRTGEVMRVTTDTSGTSLAVARNIGGTALTINDNDDLFIAGFAAQEGAGAPTPISFDATLVSNFTQIFRTAFSVTGTLQHTYLRTGSKEDEVKMKALKLHMQDIERAHFFGKKAIDNATSAQPTRYTGGLISNISNVIDASVDVNGDGSITEEQFDELLISSIFKWGSKEKIAFVGDKVAHHLQMFGKDRWTPQNVDGTYGVSLTGYRTFAGTLMVHLHPQFRQIPGMRETMIVIDFPNVIYRYLDGRDTQLLENRQNNDEDAVKHEYLTECGLELTQDKPHALIKNWATRATPTP